MLGNGFLKGEQLRSSCRLSEGEADEKGKSRKDCWSKGNRM
jgi:hypothetical protein